jgi:predicted ATP-grasp superfamily ATP-dependent carboligase
MDARVVLAGGSDRSMLSVARSLERHGITFVAAGVDPQSFIGSSRSLRGRIADRGPDARAEPEAYVSYILEIARQTSAQLLLPQTDRTIHTCARHRKTIEEVVRVAGAPAPAVLNVLDKRLNLATALRLGIPCAAEFQVERPEQVRDMVRELGFPLVLKNPGPASEGSRPRFDFRYLIANDEAELRHHLERCPPDGYPLFQRLVTGVVHNVCCFAVEGEVVASHEYVSLRRHSGYSAYRMITSAREDLKRYAELMLGELRWNGAAHLGFFVDGRDVNYMETNGRFWASTEGSVSAGWDFPYWTIQYFGDGVRPLAPPRRQGEGARSRWHYGELTALLAFLSGRDVQTGAGPGKMKAVLDYLRGFSPRVHPDVFRLDDPAPELLEHWHGLKRALRLALGWFTRRTAWQRKTC